MRTVMELSGAILRVALYPQKLRRVVTQVRTAIDKITAAMFEL